MPSLLPSKPACPYQKRMFLSMESHAYYPHLIPHPSQQRELGATNGVEYYANHYLEADVRDSTPPTPLGPRVNASASWGIPFPFPFPHHVPLRMPLSAAILPLGKALRGSAFSFDVVH